VLLVIAILWELGKKAAPAMQEYGLGFWTAPPGT
jgi:hypothetical protein